MLTVNPEGLRALLIIGWILSVVFLIGVPTFLCLIWLELKQGTPPKQP